MGQDENVLEYKNFYLFYKNLYTRLFNLIELLIDEKDFNIIKIKNNVIDFLDSYSYYLFKQKLITQDQAERTQKDLLKELRDFDKFYKDLIPYPTNNFNKIKLEYLRADNNIFKLSNENYNELLKEYYYFFNKVLLILKDFIKISSDCGFLPNIKSKVSIKAIGYANYDLFFSRLEELKLKFSEITCKVDISNSFKSRRCAYCMIIIFSAYFTNKEIEEELEKELSFNFLEDEELLKKIKNVGSYKNYIDIPLKTRTELENKLLNDLKLNISCIKRFISFEFGEMDMSPKIKKKYAYDPTDV
jgi:hypothetical protein